MRYLLACGVICVLASSDAWALEGDPRAREVATAEGEVSTADPAAESTVVPAAGSSGEAPQAPGPVTEASSTAASSSRNTPPPEEERDPDGDVDRGLGPASECLRDPVVVRHLRRPREVVRLALTHCDGAPHAEALRELSFVARAWQTPRPTSTELEAYRAAHPERSERWATERNRWLHPGLLVRLQAIADRWPTRDLVIVSGHRPNARRTSRHRFGRALDLQVDGVERAEVSAFAQTLARTGVGYYPNSSFTHVDVRETSVYWVDRSGPGERPDYGPWPPTEEESAAHGREVLARVEGALEELRVPVPSAASSNAPAPSPPSSPPAAPPPPRVEVSPQPRGSRSRPLEPEAERIRSEAFAALETLRAFRPTAPERVSDATIDPEPIDWSVPF